MEKHIFLQRQQYKQVAPDKLFNINLGVLGHVDSGKTSLCQALTHIQSTACFDKSPQSKARGITLDLGFSALYALKPKQWETDQPIIQITLVDCPGHATLIRTVVGGAQIIDAVVLVIDCIKGVQTQTAQSLAIAQLLVPKIVVLLNKIDLIPQQQRQKTIQKKIDSLRKNIFSKTKFGEKIPIIPFSSIQKDNIRMLGQSEYLISTVLDTLQMPKRKPFGPMIMLADHCFILKGKGCVFTGTLTQGQIKVGDQIQIPQYQVKRKIKSIQIFHKSVDRAGQGDRIAVMTQVLQGQKPQRTILSSYGLIKRIQSAVIQLNKISYYKFPIKAKGCFHIISGHQTVMASCRLFQTKLDPKQKDTLQKLKVKSHIFNKHQQQKQYFQFNFSMEKEYQVLNDLQQAQQQYTVFARLKFQKPLLANIGSFFIGSKLDLDQSAKKCRLAFYGHILHIQNEKQKLKLFRWKQKIGSLDRQTDERMIIIKDLISKQADLTKYINKRVKLDNGQEGVILSTFGKSGKLKVRLDNDFDGNQQTKILYQFKKFYK